MALEKLPISERPAADTTAGSCRAPVHPGFSVSQPWRENRVFYKNAYDGRSGRLYNLRKIASRKHQAGYIKRGDTTFISNDSTVTQKFYTAYT